MPEQDKKGKPQKNKALESAVKKDYKAQKRKQNVRFLDPTWEDYCADHGSPRSFPRLVLSYFKNCLNGLIHHFPSTVIPLVIVYVVMFAFNIYFWAYLNDTMWLGRGKVGGGQFVPYLVGGGIYEGTSFKGVSPFDKAGVFATGTLVAPLTFAIGLLIPRLIFRILQRGPIAPFADFLSVIPLRNHYVENGRKGNGVFLRAGVFCASIAGFLIRNPFAVFVFMLVFFLSFGQGAESQIGQSIFVIKASNKKLHNGTKKNYPVYADGMLWLYYLAVGFAIYTVLNIILWVFFDYNFYARLGVTVALMVASLFFAKSGKKDIVGSTVCFLAVFGFFLWLDRLTAFADDGGVSESPNGKITKNSGYPAMSKSARSPGISGDSGTLLSTLQKYQNFYKQKVAHGEKLTDTDAEVLKRINQKVRDLKAGNTVSANEVESLRKIMQQSNMGEMSGNVNETVKTPSVWEDFGTAAGQTFEEVARGETPAAQTVRGLTGTLTGGASEVVFTPIQAGYGMYDYVQAGGDNWAEAAFNESTKVVVSEATNYVTGKAADGIASHLGINEAKIFNTTESPKVTIGGKEMNVFSEYRNPFNNAPIEDGLASQINPFTNEALGEKGASVLRQMAFGGKETINFATGQIGNAVVNEASNSASWWGEQSVQVEQNFNNFMNETAASFSATTAASGSNSVGRSFSEGTLAQAAHESGLYNF